MAALAGVMAGFGLVLLIGLLVVNIFYILTLQKAMTAVDPAMRPIPPGLV